MPEVMARTRELAQGLPVLYTEYDSGLFEQMGVENFPSHDLPYASAFIVKNVYDCRGLVDVMSYWTFSDIFEEGGMDPNPFHNGYGLNTNVGVPKPSYRAFEQLHQLGDQLVAVTTATQNSTLGCYAVSSKSEVTAMCFNFDVYPNPVVAASVDVKICGFNSPPSNAYYRLIDDKNGNARPLWEQLGSPTYPSRAQVDAMQAASQVPSAFLAHEIEGNCVETYIQIEPYGVAALTFVF